MTKNNFDDFILWDRVIDGDVLRKQIETIMKTVQEMESLTKEADKIHAEEKVKNWLNKTIDNKNS